MGLSYWSLVRLSSIRGGNWVQRRLEGINILASSEHQFIRVLDNMVQHPSNYTSIYLGCVMQLEDCKQQCRGMSLEILRIKCTNDTLEEKLDICKRDKRSLETDIKVYNIPCCTISVEFLSCA